MTTGEATATTLTIATGMTTITGYIVQVLSSTGAVITADAVITVAAANLTVANGGATLVLAAGQLVNWMVIGT